MQYHIELKLIMEDDDPLNSSVFLHAYKCNIQDGDEAVDLFHSAADAAGLED